MKEDKGKYKARLLFKVFFIFLLLLLIPSPSPPDNFADDLFNKLQIMEVDVTVWGTINNERWAQPQDPRLTLVVMGIEDRLKGQGPVEVIPSTGYKKEVRVRDGKGDFQVTAIAQRLDPGHKVMLTMSIVSRGKLCSPDQLLSILKSTFPLSADLRAKYRVVRAYLPVKYNVFDILRELGAGSTVTQIKSGETTIWEAYSPSIAGGININGRQVNLQVAVRPDTERGCQYITIGSPLISVEY